MPIETEVNVQLTHNRRVSRRVDHARGRLSRKPLGLDEQVRVRAGYGRDRIASLDGYIRQRTSFVDQQRDERMP